MGCGSMGMERRSHTEVRMKEWTFHTAVILGPQRKPQAASLRILMTNQGVGSERATLGIKARCSVYGSSKAFRRMMYLPAWFGAF